MATLFVDKVDPQSGTSLEIGSSGDTITIPSGATLTNNGTATGFASSTPAFLATRDSNQSISANTTTKIQYDDESFDTDNTYDNSSNYRFTPGVSGKYVIGASAGVDTQSDHNHLSVEIRKNGTAIQRIYHNTGGGTIYDVSNAFAVVATADGVDDYFEMYVKINWDGSSTGKLLDEQNTQFIGYKLLGA